MSIRIPTQTILDVTNSDLGASSVAGGYAYPFKIPQDCDSIVVKFMPSVVTGGMSVYLQTSDDGGTTYYDIARTSIISAANNQNAVWAFGQTLGTGFRTAVIQSSSVITAGMGAAAASTLGSQQISGLPILGLQNRVFLVSSGGNTVNDATRIQVKVNSQSSSGQ